MNKRGSAYYNTAQRPYDDPDFSARDEWIRKQNEKYFYFNTYLQRNLLFEYKFHFHFLELEK